MVSPVASQPPLSTSPRFGFLEQRRPNQRPPPLHPGSLGPKSWGVGCGLTRCAIWGSGVFLPTLTLLSFPQLEFFSILYGNTGGSTARPHAENEGKWRVG